MDDEPKFKYEDLFYLVDPDLNCWVCGAKIWDSEFHLNWHNELGK